MNFLNECVLVGKVDDNKNLNFMMSLNFLARDKENNHFVKYSLSISIITRLFLPIDRIYTGNTLV